MQALGSTSAPQQPSSSTSKQGIGAGRASSSDGGAPPPDRSLISPQRDSSTLPAGHSPLHAFRSTMPPQQPSKSTSRQTSIGGSKAGAGNPVHSYSKMEPAGHPHVVGSPTYSPQQPSPRSVKQAEGGSNAPASSGGLRSPGGPASGPGGPASLSTVSGQPQVGMNPAVHSDAGRLPAGHTSQLSVNTGAPQQSSPKSCRQLSGTSQRSSQPVTRHSLRSIIPEGHASQTDTSAARPSQQPRASAAKQVLDASHRVDLELKQPINESETLARIIQRITYAPHPPPKAQSIVLPIGHSPVQKSISTSAPQQPSASTS